MKVHNGDHAQFELENAHVPLKDRPDWPLPSFDAKDWAECFVKMFPNCGVDEGTMTTWFACALMRGYDQADNNNLSYRRLEADYWFLLQAFIVVGILALLLGALLLSPLVK
jgi:hypothetical protein